MIREAAAEYVISVPHNKLASGGGTGLWPEPAGLRFLTGFGKKTRGASAASGTPGRALWTHEIDKARVFKTFDAATDALRRVSRLRDGFGGTGAATVNQKIDKTGNPATASDEAAEYALKRWGTLSWRGPKDRDITWKSFASRIRATKETGAAETATVIGKRTGMVRDFGLHLNPADAASKASVQKIKSDIQKGWDEFDKVYVLTAPDGRTFAFRTKKPAQKFKGTVVRASVQRRALVGVGAGKPAPVHRRAGKWYPGEASARSNPLAGATTGEVITILKAHLTQYDKRMSSRRGYNMYALGHYLRAAGQVEDAVPAGPLDANSARALKTAIGRYFIVSDMPPAKKTIKAIDEFLAGKPLKYPVAKKKAKPRKKKNPKAGAKASAKARATNVRSLVARALK